MLSESSSEPERSWNRLRNFQGRADLISDSDIAKRLDLATLGSTMKILVRVGESKVRIEREHPPVSQIEQAAARLRPVFLPQEIVHHGKVTKALSYLTQKEAPEVKALAKAVSSAWKGFDSQRTWAMEAGKFGEKPDTTGQLWDRQIAHDWLYGYVIHNDLDAQHRIRYISPDDRMMAGLLWVKDATLLVRATQQLIVDLEDVGALNG